MSSLFPLRGAVELDDTREPKLVGMDEDVADDVFEALSSGTTRRIFGHLHEEPHTASDLADLTDTSVQNVQYHLGKLEDAGLVDVVDTWYSERGTEMKVYAPADESLVVFAGGNERDRLRDLLKRAVGILAVLGPVAALLGWFAGRLAEPAERMVGQAGGGDGGDGSIQMTADSVSESGAEGASYAADAGQQALGLDPTLLVGLAFFLGGAFVLALVAATWYWRE